MTNILLKIEENNLMNVLNKRKERAEYEENYLRDEDNRHDEFEQYKNEINHDNYQNNERFYHTNNLNREDLIDSRFNAPKSPKFEFEDKEQYNDQKNFSRSYNRNIMIHKRSFLNPKADEKHYDIQDNQEKLIGKSATHGFERNFKHFGDFINGQEIRDNFQSNKCDIKFNTKSVNYDMSEIELPAYCKTHPDGKLLYIITPERKESELGCVYCVLEINQKNLRYSIVEVRQKLEEYIDHTSQLLNKTNKGGYGDVESIITKINTCKDREIARIREYYDKVMDALAIERDKYITQIVSKTISIQLK